MDSKDNLWTRRANNSSSNKPSVPSNDDKTDGSTRSFSSSKQRVGGESNSTGRNPFNSITPLATRDLSLPTASSSKNFGLGTGAFGFGSASKTPKTPGTAFDFGKVSSAAPTPSLPAEEKEKTKDNTAVKTAAAPGRLMKPAETASSHHLKWSWVIWYRPSSSKTANYEESIKPQFRIATVEDFWLVYTHLKRPSRLPIVSDYHFFKEGIRPVWEDEQNKQGGKWIMRLKKGVADRYWEWLLMAMIGDQFLEAGEEVCGAVLSARSGEDVLSIWTKNDGGRNVKIRETVKRELRLPPDTNIQWKSHDDSIAHRSAIDQARQEKGSTDKRRTTLGAEDSAADRNDVTAP